MQPSRLSSVGAVALAFLACSEARAFQAPSGAEVNVCFVRADFDWKQFANSTELAQRQYASWQVLFRTMTVLINEAYGTWPYGSASFPLAGTRFEGSYAIFHMKASSCVQGRDFVVQLFSAYRQRLTSDELADAPAVDIPEEPATNYQYTCGLRATASSCPEAVAPR
jgi:hypothetical protein